MSENKKTPLCEDYQPTNQQQTPSIKHGYQPNASSEERGYQPTSVAGSQQGQSSPLYRRSDYSKSTGHRLKQIKNNPRFLP